MTAPKKPQDHKSKQVKPVDGEYSVEVRGRTWKVRADAMDDFELMEDIGEIDKGQAQRFPSALKRLLGDDQYREAMALLRDPETKRVSLAEGTDFFAEVFEALPNS